MTGTRPHPPLADLLAGVRAPVRFWACPVWGHGPAGSPTPPRPVVTWKHGVATCTTPGCGRRSTDTVTVDQVTHLVATLPPWQPGLDDDPTWLRAVEDTGLTHLPTTLPDDSVETITRRLLAQEATRRLPAPTRVEVSQVWLAAQPRVRLDALAHYLTASGPGSVLWDPDGWYGNDVPVLGAWPNRLGGGYLILDGTHRVAAGRLSGATHLHAHVVSLP